MALNQGQSPRLTGDSTDHLRFDPQTIPQAMPSLSTPHKLSSPHLAGTEVATSIGDNPATGTNPDDLPEQKIFPGIVHETVQRGSILAQVACDK